MIPTKADFNRKKQSDKRYAIEADGASSIKVIFTLLAKVITFYIELFIVKIRELSLQLAFLLFYRFQTTVLALGKPIYTMLCNFLNVFFGVLM